RPKKTRGLHPRPKAKRTRLKLPSFHSGQSRRPLFPSKISKSKEKMMTGLLHRHSAAPIWSERLGSISLAMPRPFGIVHGLRAVPLHSRGLLPRQLVVNPTKLPARGSEDLTNANGFNRSQF